MVGRSLAQEGAIPVADLAETRRGRSDDAAPARRRARRHAALAGAVLLAAAAAAGAWWWAAAGPAPARYAIQPASRGAITRTVSATGTVNPVLTILVGSYVSGVVQEVNCDYNTRVSAGQVCARIDPRPYQATLDQYLGQLARDQAILERDRANLARYERLAADNYVARQQAEDQAFLVRQGEGTVRIDQALVDAARLNLSYTSIVSPVDGTVVSRNITRGQTVAASFQTPTLFLIATDLRSMQVDANVSESDIGSIRPGNPARFTVDAFPARVFEGRVSQVRQSPQTVQNVVTYDAVISVDNADLALMPGMTAAARIVVDRRDDVLRVPSQALRYTPAAVAAGLAPPPAAGTDAGETARIWIVRDGQAVAVPVATGLDDERFVEILRGAVAPGDPVVVGEDRAGARSALPLPRF
jgi:HlyD family secretion protein